MKNSIEEKCKHFLEIEDYDTEYQKRNNQLWFYLGAGSMHDLMSNYIGKNLEKTRLACQELHAELEAFFYNLEDEEKKLTDKKKAFTNTFIVISARDTMDPFDENSSGPIIWETYLKDANITKAMQKQKDLSITYGQTIICKLVPATADEIKQALNEAEMF